MARVVAMKLWQDFLKRSAEIELYISPPPCAVTELSLTLSGMARSESYAATIPKRSANQSAAAVLYRSVGRLRRASPSSAVHCSAEIVIFLFLRQCVFVTPHSRSGVLDERSFGSR